MHQSLVDRHRAWPAINVEPESLGATESARSAEHARVLESVVRLTSLDNHEVHEEVI
jgi:hypothetical protein